MTDRIPIVCGYARSSTASQQHSVPAQVVAMRQLIKALPGYTVPAAYFDSPDELQPVPGMFVDRATSAFATNFADRSGAKNLLATLQAGDALIVHRVDRLCRSMVDFCNLTTMLDDRKIRLIVCTPHLDLGTADGRFFARHMANIAEWESDRKSERIREALRQKRIREGLAPLHKRERHIILPSDYRPPEGLVQWQAPQIPGRVIIYLRVSHADSARSGLGLLAQAEISRKFADALMAANAGLTFLDTFTDPEVSAYTIPMRDRPAGHLVDAQLKRGDHVVFASLDRAFRSVHDMVNTWHDWEKRGVDIHFVEDGISMSDPVGRIMAQAMIQFAEMEAFLASERTKEARGIAAAEGRYTGGMRGHLPTFWKLTPCGRLKNSRKLSLDRTKLAEFRLFRWYLGAWETKKRMTQKQALDKLEETLAKREGRPAIPESGVGKCSKLAGDLRRAFENHKERLAEFTRNGVFSRPWTERCMQRGRLDYGNAHKEWLSIGEQRRGSGPVQMSAQDIMDRVLNAISARLNTPVEDMELDEPIDVLDDLQMIEIILDLEDQFGIAIPERYQDEMATSPMRMGELMVLALDEYFAEVAA